MFSQWSIFKNYINSRKIGSVIFRKDIMILIYGSMENSRNYCYGTTVDGYRRNLTILGVLETVDRGAYEIKAHIKESALSSEVHKLANSYDYRQWFHDIITT